MNLAKSILIHASLFAVGAVTAAACFQVNYNEAAFRCNPSAEGNCPDGYNCCSDDPAAQSGDLPKFTTALNAGSTPIFADNNNSLSSSGVCVDSSVEISTTLANSCPIPCNPTWTLEEVTAVCGPNSSCCQTQEIDQALDCVLDPLSMKFRAVDGGDIGETMTRPDGSQIMINWAPGTHATHQDPAGLGCQAFTMDPIANSPANSACYAQLTVANQRGFCVGGGSIGVCPCIEDPCRALNGEAPLCPPV